MTVEFTLMFVLALRVSATPTTSSGSTVKNMSMDRRGAVRLVVGAPPRALWFRGSSVAVKFIVVVDVLVHVHRLATALLTLRGQGFR